MDRKSPIWHPLQMSSVLIYAIIDIDSVDCRIILSLTDQVIQPLQPIDLYNISSTCGRETTYKFRHYIGYGNIHLL